MQIQCLVNSKKKFRISNLGSAGGIGKAPSRSGEQSKVKMGVFLARAEEAKYRGGCIIFGKCGNENNFNFIAVF